MAQIRDLDHAFHVLGCTRNSTPDQIKVQFRRLQKKYHTDLYESQNLPEALKELLTQKVQEINEAYGIISKWIEQQAPPKQSSSNYKQKRDQARTTSPDSKRPANLDETVICENPTVEMGTKGISLLVFFGGIWMLGTSLAGIGILLIVTGALTFAGSVWRLTTKQPTVILNRQGITFAHWKIVPWEEVARVSHTATHLQVDFHNPEAIGRPDHFTFTNATINIEELLEKITWFYDIQHSKPR